MRLGILAHSRTGDKGDTSNISVIAYDPADYPHLERRHGRTRRGPFRRDRRGRGRPLRAAEDRRAEFRAPPRPGRRGHAVAGAGRPWQVAQLADPRPRDVSNLPAKPGALELGPLKGADSRTFTDAPRMHTLHRTLDYAVGIVHRQSGTGRSRIWARLQGSIFVMRSDPGAHTAVVVKLLLPPRQSRGVSR